MAEVVMCVYGIISKTNCSLYVGSSVNFYKRKASHIRDLVKNRHYNTHLQNHVYKYGIDDLLFYVIKIVKCRECLIPEEQFYIDNLAPKFNICKIADRRTGIALSESHKRKIGIAHKGKILSEETKQKLFLINKGKVQSKSTIEKRAAKNRGKKRSLEVRLKMSKAMKGIPKSAEAIRNVSIALTGRKLSEEHKKKIAPYGRIVSEETRLKMSKAIEIRKEKGTYKINKTKVIQLNLKEEELFIWESASLAARVNKADPSGLLAVARGRSGKTLKGFKWKIA